jgi:hypothetical protein
MSNGLRNRIVSILPDSVQFTSRRKTANKSPIPDDTYHPIVQNHGQAGPDSQRVVGWMGENGIRTAVDIGAAARSYELSADHLTL